MELTLIIKQIQNNYSDVSNDKTFNAKANLIWFTRVISVNISAAFNWNISNFYI